MSSLIIAKNNYLAPTLYLEFNKYDTFVFKIFEP